MSATKNDSQRPSSPNSPRMRELACSNCGTRFIGSGGCPSCGSGLTKSDGGEDMLRKTFDEPDMKKGF